MTQITGFRKDSIGAYIQKDPDSTLDYSVNWEDWLDDGDTIVASSWTIQSITGDAAPITRVTDSFVASGLASIWLSGGTRGYNYRITNRITTYHGLVDERYFRIFVKDRTG